MRLPEALLEMLGAVPGVVTDFPRLKVLGKLNLPSLVIGTEVAQELMAAMDLTQIANLPAVID